jgi:hypothetical protein
MHRWVAVNLRGRRLQDPRFHALGETEHVDRAVHARLCRLDRIELIVHRARWTGEIVDLVDLHIERERHIVTHQLEIGGIQQPRDVALGPGVEIVDTQHVVPLAHQPPTQMRPEKSGAAGH